MSQNSAKNYRVAVLAGLGAALLVAILLSPLASKDPDGLDRVAKDLKFEDKALANSPAKQLPFTQFFNEYRLKGVRDEKVATAIAGIIGTLSTFGLAWGVGKLATLGKKAAKNQANSSGDNPEL
jgi:cobalt/nickel transport protein